MAAAEQPTEILEPYAQPSITFRALAIGAFLTVVATNAGSYARFILHATRLDQNHLSMAAVVPLMVIVLFLNRLLKLGRGELVVVFIMPLIGATMPTYFIGKMVANFTVPYYLASPENQWENHYGGLLPAWSVMPEGEPLRRFFEGLPRGASIPWSAWTVTVFWWSTVIVAYYGCCLCLMVIFRKQWVVNERIAYPLMEVPLAVMDEPDERGFFRIPVMNRSAFWGRVRCDVSLGALERDSPLQSHIPSDSVAVSVSSVRPGISPDSDADVPSRHGVWVFHESGHPLRHLVVQLPDDHGNRAVQPIWLRGGPI